MNKKATTVSGTLLCMVVVAAVWVVCGCKPNQNENSQSTFSASAATNVSILQIEIDRPLLHPVEHAPLNRRLFISQSASNRHDWVVQELERGYRATGRTNVTWDAAVKNLIVAYADYTRINTTNWPALEKSLAAVESTCDDPMVKYMRVRYASKIQPAETSSLEFLKAHQAMMESEYHPYFKFMAGLRAIDSVRTTDKNTRRGNRINWTTWCLEDLARDTNAPITEVFESAGLWVDHTYAKGWIEYVLGDLLPILEKNWGGTEPYLRFRGRAEIRWAWGDRGTGYADSVSDASWVGFKGHLEQAEQFLTKAWEMNTNNAETAYLMMRVELGQGRGRSRMDTWFNRAMSLETNFFDAASLMSFYLEPRWYGSESKALTFARSCVSSEKWGGNVPLVLANLHRSLATYQHLSNSPAYWQRSQVWRDVNSSFEKFFTLNPDAAGWRHDYANDAFNCGHYDVFLEQTKHFKFGTNFSFFGGQHKFEQMLATAITASTNINRYKP